VKCRGIEVLVVSDPCVCVGVDGGYKPWLIVECKEMNVPLSESVLQQVLHYNSKLETQYIIITNGNDTFGFDVRNTQPTVLTALPNFVTD